MRDRQLGRSIRSLEAQALCDIRFAVSRVRARPDW